MEAQFQTCGPTGQRILQLHPTLRCNLRCEHCYSSSGPWARVELDARLVEGILTDAARMGYEVVSISGGEPFLYSHLAEILRHARALGMRTTVTTNGYFLDSHHLEPLRDCLNQLAISLDGPAEIHNRVRASPQAFDRLCAGLECLRACGLSFGFIHTVTRESWIHLLWLAEFAAANGARLLQLHPLELAGRAEIALACLAPDVGVLSKVYLLAAALAAKYSGTMTIQTDLLHREQVLANPGIIYGSDPLNDCDGTIPATQLGVLVLEPDGAVVPLTYGFSRRYQVTDINQQTLATAWAGYLRDTYPEFRRLCHRVFEEVIAPGAPSLFNWHERIAAKSHIMADAVTTASKTTGRLFIDHQL
jgi:MoaA/NifB/PqqE/SkfB family radical SAM enzyme